MKKEDWMVLALWVVLLNIGLILLINIGSVIQAVGDVAAAFISFLAVLVGAILTHALTHIREQSNQQEVEKQRNYLKLIGIIDIAIRSPSGNDNLSKVHLESWVVGSDRVVKLTQDILEAKGDVEKMNAVKELLKQMRSEVGLPELDEKISLKGLFPVPGGF